MCANHMLVRHTRAYTWNITKLLRKRVPQTRYGPENEPSPSTSQVCIGQACKVGNKSRKPGSQKKSARSNHLRATVNRATGLHQGKGSITKTRYANDGDPCATTLSLNQVVEGIRLHRCDAYAGLVFQREILKA